MTLQYPKEAKSKFDYAIQWFPVGGFAPKKGRTSGVRRSLVGEFFTTSTGYLMKPGGEYVRIPEFTRPGSNVFGIWHVESGLKI